MGGPWIAVPGALPDPRALGQRMGFLSGPITFECFRISGSPPDHFGPQHVEILERFAISQTVTSSTEQAASVSWPASICWIWTSAWKRT